MHQTIEINPRFAEALHLMEQTKRNIFITGRAGTGKSTLLEYFRSITRKNVVVLAPTGVAAVNISGQTIHSFFGFRPDVTVEKSEIRQKSLFNPTEHRTIITGSVVRADLLELCQSILAGKRQNPGDSFGELR